MDGIYSIISMIRHLMLSMHDILYIVKQYLPGSN